MQVVQSKNLLRLPLNKTSQINPNKLEVKKENQSLLDSKTSCPMM
jgi:hypothetical protein